MPALHLYLSSCQQLLPQCINDLNTQKLFQVKLPWYPARYCTSTNDWWLAAPGAGGGVKISTSHITWITWKQCTWPGSRKCHKKTLWSAASTMQSTEAPSIVSRKSETQNLAAKNIFNNLRICLPSVLKCKKKSCSLPVLQWIHVYFGNITGVSVLEDLQLLSLGANLPVEVKNGWCTEVSYLWEGPGDRFPGVYPPQHSDTCWWRRYSSENGLESATLNQPQPPPPQKKKKNNLLASVKPTSTTKISLLTQNFRGTSMREIKVQEGPVAATARRKPLKHMASNGQGWWIGAAKRPVE